MKKILFFQSIVLGILFLIPSMSIHAQQIRDSNRGSLYYLGSGDELLVPINIWGYVRNPGQYMVPNNTDLIALLSYAGGPTDEARISRIRIVRNDPKTGNKTIRVNVKKYLDTADSRLIPILKPNDTIIVKGTSFSWIRKFFSFLSTFAVFAQMFYFVALASNQFK